MAQRTGLGKGLDALIPAGGKVPPSVSTGSTGGVQQVAVEAIQRNPRQPRIHFKEEELAELAASIREHGVIQPLIVTPSPDGKFTLIAGERRWQAAQRVLAGLSQRLRRWIWLQRPPSLAWLSGCSWRSQPPSLPMRPQVTRRRKKQSC